MRHTARARGRTGRGRVRKREGIALILTLCIIAIMTVLLADMEESTATDYAVAVSLRDNLRAEYMAKSGLNLTRLLVSNQRNIRQVIAPLYAMALGRQPPEIPVWSFANSLLQPFCQYEQSKDLDIGVDFSAAQGLGETPGSCEIVAVAENGKINVSDPLGREPGVARKEVAQQLFAMTGGYQSPSPFDPLFSSRDDTGQFTSRLDVISSIIDWWDADQNRTLFDPGKGEVSTAGTEDDPYSSYPEPYHVKNAAFDSIDEIRMVRGVSDDFWATFVEPKPDDILDRRFTIYGSGSVNPNEAPPEVMLARLCSIVGDQTLCVDPLEAAKFIQLVGTIRAIVPIPFFSRPVDFLNFVEGKGGARDLYPLLKSMLGETNPLLFKPISIADTKKRTELQNLFITSVGIISVDATGIVGRSRVRLRTVLNFHSRWTAPPPNAGSPPKLGVVQYYRVD